MEKQKIIGITIILLILYTSVVIVNPHTDKKTVFIHEDMDKILGVTVPRGTISTKSRDSTLEANFSEPVSTVNIQLNKSVLDLQPHRIRCKIKLLTRKSLMVNVSVIKTLNEQGKTQSIGKLYTFSNNKSSFVYVRVWQLREERSETLGNNYTDKVQLNVSNPYNPKETTNHILGIKLYNFRYVYYVEGEGKRGAPIHFGMKEMVFFFLPFLVILLGPFLFYCKRNWEELFL